jgi:integrase
MSLTDRMISGLTPPASGQQFHADRSVPGFGVRVSQGGTKTFVLSVGTERRRITIGRYPIVSLAQAREMAKTLLARRQLGIDKPLSPRFGKVQEEYLAERDRKVRRSTRQRDDYLFKLFGSLLDKRIAEITPNEVQSILDRTKAPWTRREAMIRFSCLVRFADRKGYVQNWPLHRLEATVAHTPRDRVLHDDELANVLVTARAWSASGQPFGTIIELLIYTGQRRQQIGSLDRSHVNFEESTITWPPHLMKTDRRHSIPMGGEVRTILEPSRVNGLYFPNVHGRSRAGRLLFASSIASSRSTKAPSRGCGWTWRS